MKQGDFAVQTAGQGVYTPTQAGTTGVYQCDGLASAFEIDAQGGRIGASFTPNPFEDVAACTVTGVYLPDPLDEVGPSVAVGMCPILRRNTARKVGVLPEHAAPYSGWVDSGTGEPVSPEVERQAAEAIKAGAYTETSPGVRTYRLPGTITPMRVDMMFYGPALGEQCDEPVETTTGNSVAYDLPSFQYVERPPMTLNEIVAAVRTNELVTGRDMRYAIVAFDVLMSQLHIDQHVEQLQEFFKAATAVPREYAGHMNDPENPEAVEWYKAMQGVSGS